MVLYRTIGAFYRTTGDFYRTTGVFYRTIGIIYRTTRAIYRTNGVFYKITRVFFRIEKDSLIYKSHHHWLHLKVLKILLMAKRVPFVPYLQTRSLIYFKGSIDYSFTVRFINITEIRFINALDFSRVFLNGRYALISIQISRLGTSFL